eukprot:sb/3464516/
MVNWVDNLLDSTITKSRSVIYQFGDIDIWCDPHMCGDRTRWLCRQVINDVCALNIHVSLPGMTKPMGEEGAEEIISPEPDIPALNTQPPDVEVQVSNNGDVETPPPVSRDIPHLSPVVEDQEGEEELQIIDSSPPVVPDQVDVVIDTPVVVEVETVLSSPTATTASELTSPTTGTAETLSTTTDTSVSAAGKVKPPKPPKKEKKEKKKKKKKKKKGAPPTPPPVEPEPEPEVKPTVYNQLTIAVDERGGQSEPVSNNGCCACDTTADIPETHSDHGTIETDLSTAGSPSGCLIFCRTLFPDLPIFSVRPRSTDMTTGEAPPTVTDGAVTEAVPGVGTEDTTAFGQIGGFFNKVGSGAMGAMESVGKGVTGLVTSDEPAPAPGSEGVPGSEGQGAEPGSVTSPDGTTTTFEAKSPTGPEAPKKKKGLKGKFKKLMGKRGKKNSAAAEPAPEEPGPATAQ